MRERNNRYICCQQHVAHRQTGLSHGQGQQYLAILELGVLADVVEPGLVRGPVAPGGQQPGQSRVFVTTWP